MSDAEQPTAELYREAADRLRELAKQIPLPEIQAELASVAAYFERMATHLEQTLPRPPSAKDGQG
jgi:hypothetical protein